ncbi:S8 family serine peptidase [Vulcaniibacterium tengchongense]|uniref:PA domain-containing protein n=1 Tax=Vulcaniibacterium tengchongense TaxID=1273429 RepID=A0A3N4VF92_9GAMM|nr:S8 family serine peptidase [Vulcaniibacterium tengchongense]RPE81328.1 PA domain-containing protein [Vulcaniibacterium tengchongense]
MYAGRKTGVALAAALLIALSGATAQSSPADDGPPPAAAASSDRDPNAARPYIIGFAEPALARYRGERPGLAAPARTGGAGEGGRVDVASASARAYVADLAARQRDHEARIGSAIGRPLNVRLRMQHAFNGVIADLTPIEAEELARLPEVALIEGYREYELDTDVGPRFIGADEVWEEGTGLPPGLIDDGRRRQHRRGALGEGVVVGVIDSGINFGSPSFAAVGGDGYRHRNPLGSGNHLGTCAPGGVDAGRCNDKLIGGYDFVCGAPANLCGVAGLREEPGFGDSNGHGSHTASTAAGNVRTATLRGVQRRISGVAPHANLIAYDVCYTEIATDRGLCPNVSSVAAVNQAMADGVDVINFSIGGGTSPWSEAVSQAFLAATDAGIFVAASAGNSGPASGTLGHVEPWVATAGALQHGRGGFDFLLAVTGPGTPPANLQDIALAPGSGGIEHAADIPGTTPLRASAGIDTASDGCAAYPPGAFQGAIALVRRGTCNFSVKANNAAAAGAIAVVIANNQPGVTTPSVPGTTVPVFLVAQGDGDALRDFAQAHAEATAAIPFPATVRPNTPDQMGDFSSRGPTAYDLVKPDVAAPGVAVLAASAGDTIAGHEDLVELLNGTSMASPHVAGAAALLRQLHPSWSAAEIKSALMMTAKERVLKEDGATPADPFARGAGRIRVDLAARAGLVMDETTENFLAADPAAGGQVHALNLPSLGNARCIERCRFERTFRGTRRPVAFWLARLEGVRGTVSPAVFAVGAGQRVKLKIEVDTRRLPADGRWHFGRVELKPLGGFRSPELHLPVAVAVPEPAIVVAPDAGIELTLAAGQSGQAQLSVGNGGGGVLQFRRDDSRPVGAMLHASTNDGVTVGTRATFYTDQNTGSYAADDFDVEEPVTLNFLSANGFTPSGNPVASIAQSVTWAVFPDAGGVPAGNPQTSRERAVWSYTSAPNGPGMGSPNNWLMFDPVLAGQQVRLQPGKYWMTVHIDATFANRWAWYQSNQAAGLPPLAVLPASSAAWSPIGSPGLAFEVSGLVACGAPWLTAVTPASGTAQGAAAQTLTVAVSAAGLAPGRYRGRVCLASNDPNQPLLGVPVRLTVTP